MPAILDGETIYEPLVITARLMAGARVGDSFISIEIAEQESSGRDRYRIYIDMPGGREFEIDDLRSGCQGGDIYEGMENLLGFLGAAVESHRYRLRTGREGENEDLFVHEVVEWAEENENELTSLQIDLEELIKRSREQRS